MSRRFSLLIKSAAVLVLGGIMAAPLAASAGDRNGYGYYDDADGTYVIRHDRYHESCGSSTAGGAFAGAVVGGAAGAVPGAVAGAIIGGAIGNSNDQCHYARGRSSYNDRYSYDDDYGYSDRRSDDGYAYYGGRGDRRYYDGDRSNRRDDRYRDRNYGDRDPYVGHRYRDSNW